MRNMASKEIDFWINHNLKNYQSKFNRKIAPENLKMIISWLRSPASEKTRKQIEKLSVSTASRLANRWAERLDKKASFVENFAAIESVYSFSDGHEVVKLIRRSAFQREGKLMKHCVAYYNQENQTIYSLRDEKNQPCCTIEVLENKIVQIKGIKNNAVSAKKRPYVKTFIFNYLKDCQITSDFKNLALIKKEDTTFYDIDTDTYPLTIKEDLDLSELELTTIPNIICLGKLDLRGNKITKIPPFFIQHGSLILERNHIKEIPAAFKQTAYLDLTNNQIEYLPEHFVQTATLDLANNLIKELPENFIQTNILYLSNNLITHLPENFKQTRILDLSHNKIKKLPLHFTQTDHLYLGGNEITHLSKNFKQANNKDLCLAHNHLKYLPDNFKQKGQLIISHNRIKKLPKNFTQTDILQIAGNKLKFLPKNFKQSSDLLDLSNNQLIELPDSFQIKHELKISNNQLKKIPDKHPDFLLHNRKQFPQKKMIAFLFKLLNKF